MSEEKKKPQGTPQAKSDSAAGTQPARKGAKRTSKKSTKRAVSKKTTAQRKAPAGAHSEGRPAEKLTSRAKPPAEAPSLAALPKRKSKGAPPSGLESTSADPSVPAAGAVPSVPLADPPPAWQSAADDAYPLSSVDVGFLGIGSPVFVPPSHLDPSPTDDVGTKAEPEAASERDGASVEVRIREIEERLEGLMASELSQDLDAGPPPSSETPQSTDEESVLASAREVLESPYYRKRWGRGSLDQHSFDVDDFGMDPAFEEKLRPALEFLFKRYFRTEVEGIRNVPEAGRAVIVANHSGALPLDGLMLRRAIVSRHSTRDDFRWLAEDFSFYLPFLGVAMNRMGAVRACPENAERLLEQEQLVGVFPEGAEGIKKLYRHRYHLQRFGRGGFVRLCLKMGSPIVPTAVVGAEETNPILYRFDNLSKLLGLDYLPITPTFPLLGPFGLVPAPTRWRIVFGEPLDLSGYGPQAADDHVLVGRLAEQVRQTINELLETALRRRKSIWF